MQSTPKYIPGIYNYCDRWCERCTFTSRCRNYENTSNLKPEQLDINNKAFWDNISINFTNAIKLLHKAAAKHGIDLNTAMTKEEEKAFEVKQAAVKKEIKQHQLLKLCKEYQIIARPFFEDEISDELVDKTRELVSHLHIGMQTEENVVNTMATLGDCQEIIQWHLFFIDAKLQRALHGKLEDDEDDGYPKDSDGSAKIAIIAIEKTMAAWARLYDLLPTAQDTALSTLAILSRIKSQVQQDFPQAMQFKRPGFDD